MIRTVIAKAGLGLAASATLMGGLAAPQAASAQTGGYYDRGYHETYRDCRERKSSNAVAGAIIGGIAGAVIGSNVAGRGDRGAGTAIGGVGGAAVGASIGSSGTDCGGPRRAYYRNGYYDRGYYNGGYAPRGYYGGGYYSRPYGARPYAPGPYAPGPYAAPVYPAPSYAAPAPAYDHQYSNGGYDSQDAGGYSDPDDRYSDRDYAPDDYRDTPPPPPSSSSDTYPDRDGRY